MEPAKYIITEIKLASKKIINMTRCSVTVKLSNFKHWGVFLILFTSLSMTITKQFSTSFAWTIDVVLIISSFQFWINLVFCLLSANITEQARRSNMSNALFSKIKCLVVDLKDNFIFYLDQTKNVALKRRQY